MNQIVRKSCQYKSDNGYNCCNKNIRNVKEKLIKNGYNSWQSPNVCCRQKKNNNYKPSDNLGKYICPCKLHISFRHSVSMKNCFYFKSFEYSLYDLFEN